MESEDKIVESNNIELNDIQDSQGQHFSSEKVGCSDNEEGSEENVQSDNARENAGESSWKAGNIKDEIKKSQSVINIFHGIKIDNNGGIITGDGAQFQDIFFGTGFKAKNSEKGLADDLPKLERWVAQHYGQIDVAFLISCAVFHDMPYTLISEASEKLYKYFDEKEEGNISKTARAQNVRTFGAEICQGKMNTYAGQIEIDCICFSKEEQVKNILKTIWNEFPQLRKAIVIWLKNYIIGNKVTISERARNTLGYLSGLDYYYFSHKMVEIFLKKKSLDDDLVLVQVMTILYQQPKYQSNIDSMLKNWRTLRNVHYLLITIFLCVIVENQKKCLEDAMHIYIEEMFRAIQQKEENEFSAERLSFFAIGIRKVIFYRVLVEKLYQMANQKTIVRERNNVCVLFLELFYADVMLSRFEEGVEEEALFVKMVTIKSNFREKLCFLWQMVWKKNQFRIFSYDILGQYFSSLLKQERRKKISFFVNAALGGEYEKQIRLDFINKILIKCKKYEVTN